MRYPSKIMRYNLVKNITSRNSSARFRHSLKGILAKKQFCSKSQVGVCVKLFQLFKVDNSLPVLNAVRFASAI